MLVQRGDDAAIPLVRSLMVQATNDMHLGATVFGCLLAACDDLLIVHRVAFRVTQITAEGTKPASIHTHIGRIQVRVDVVVADVAVHPLANLIGKLTQLLKRHFRLVHKNAIVQRQTLTMLNLVSQIAQPRGNFAIHHRLNHKRIVGSFTTG